MFARAGLQNAARVQHGARGYATLREIEMVRVYRWAQEIGPLFGVKNY